MPENQIAKLNELFNKAIQEDNELYSEQRSNVLLNAGEHYSKKKPAYLERITNSAQLTSEQKIRLTKNHIQSICKTYVNYILSSVPGATPMPNNERENADMKAAELHKSVWEAIKYNNKIEKKHNQYANDFIVIGEVFVKIFWDETKGSPIDIGEAFDPMTGQTTSQRMMSGDLVFERIFGFNVFRDPTAKDLDDAAWIGYRKLVDTKSLKNKFSEDEEKLSFIEQTAEGTYTVFNGATGKYEDVKGKTLVREFYYRPCMEYPNGYYYITTQKGILAEGDLPGGIFPIVYAGFDEIQTAARFRSIIKQLRPYQAEINRAASKIAEHQITLGDDKVILPAGGKISQAEVLPGIRGIKVSGMSPTVIPGRDGSQFQPYVESQINEMRSIAMVAETLIDENSNLDAYSMLFRNMKEKKKFSSYITKYETFIVDLCRTALELFRLHAPVQMVIPIIGKHEQVNMEEFKNMDRLSYQIKVVPRTDDIESQMGKQLTLNNVLQYVGTNMSQQDIGQVIRSMPFVNKEEILSDLTLNYDVVQSYILALDKGKPFPISNYINQDYIIQKLTKRMSDTDFMTLDPQIQGLYQQILQTHEQVKAKQLMDAAALNSQFIPTGGYLVGVDFYINPNPQDPTKTRRARVPYEALAWLIQRLQQQGLTQESLDGMQQANLQDMAKMVVEQGQNAQTQPLNNGDQSAQQSGPNFGAQMSQANGSNF